ncbi:MAG: DMT family transporter [Ectothiorhodospiraceae bacterium]|nr:DMT family transporter [Ectothiorhodospiraceae bacterium]MCH8505027.1 DMT family transporter [Ectothiorhodospiraceae bacterium]
MSASRLFLVTSLAMLAFAANSVLARVALSQTAIDPATFTAVRIVTGAMALWLIVRLQMGPPRPGAGNWVSASALFVYAAGFSLAYVTLDTGIGALILFGAVQATMIGAGLWAGERLRGLQTLGFVISMAGLVYLLAPGAVAPSPLGAAFMLLSGMAWGVYSLRGRGNTDPVMTTAGNFLRAVPFAVGLFLLGLPWLSVDAAGLFYAVLSGAVASGMGYVVWYTVLPSLKAMQAAIAQLSVPVIAAVAGVILLAEPLSWRLAVSAVAILGGIGLVVWKRERR